MSILGIFSFKKKLQEIVTEENFNFVKETIKTNIIEQIKRKLEGSKKMDNVVDKVVETLQEKIKSDNKLVQWIIDNILIKNVRIIAQSIYDDLKEIVEGL